MIKVSCDSCDWWVWDESFMFPLAPISLLHHWRVVSQGLVEVSRSLSNLSQRHSSMHWVRGWTCLVRRSASLRCALWHSVILKCCNLLDILYIYILIIIYIYVDFFTCCLYLLDFQPETAATQPRAPLCQWRLTQIWKANEQTWNVFAFLLMQLDLAKAENVWDNQQYSKRMQTFKSDKCGKSVL